MKPHMPDELFEQLLRESLDVSDNGFTDKVIGNLPPQPFLKKSQWIVWTIAGLVMTAAIAIVFANSSGITWQHTVISTSLVTVVLLLAHFEEIEI